MSDALEKKHEILQRKYKNLRSNHRRLAGVALRLAEALEAFLKDDEKPDMNDILMSCSNMYPGLIEATEKAPAEEAPPDEKEMSPVLEDVDAEKKNLEGGGGRGS
ncbi:UNVERIFIED_CONTAM: hypothetical protein PYX00_003276 [Menopon gallinae]|uniref:Uncharacterized protein n=1 Tax=Menopon gallinae TaxID=328185 RepID=A0AAW2I110_9NEOP